MDAIKEKTEAFMDYLESIVKPDGKMSRFDDIINAVLEETDGITLDAIKAPNRSRTYSIPRQLIMYLELEYGYPSTRVGEALQRTHATVLYGRKCVIIWQKNPSSYRREFDLYKRVKERLNKQL